MTIPAQHIRSARLHLQRNDATMKLIIKQVGPCQIKLKRDRFVTLVQSIIGQQISGSAANTIFNRLVTDVGTKRIKPESLLEYSVDQFRELGISRQKATYLLDLAEKVESSAVQLKQVSKMDNDAVISQLTQIKGVGPWTAQMFLMFSLGRLDVFPADDLGIRNAMIKAYGLEEPSRQALCDIAKPWIPYSTIACWYLWKYLDGPAGLA